MPERRQPITRDHLLAALARHIGVANGVHAPRLVAEIRADLLPSSADERRVRDLVVELRTEGHHVYGRPETGYYMAATAAELDACCLWLHDRAMTTLVQIARMRCVAEPDLRGQLRLPT